jgi:hypothetical protein
MLILLGVFIALSIGLVIVLFFINKKNKALEDNLRYY